MEQKKQGEPPPLTVDGQIVDHEFVKFHMNACHNYIAIIVEKYTSGQIDHLTDYLNLAHKKLHMLGRLANMERLRGAARTDLDSGYAEVKQLQRQHDKKEKKRLKQERQHLKQQPKSSSSGSSGSSSSSSSSSSNNSNSNSNHNASLGGGGARK